MTPFEVTAVFVVGVLLIILTLWLYSATKEREDPPQLSEDEQKKLQLIERAMITGAEIKGSIRIVTHENIVITFRLDKPGFQVNASFTDYLPEKFL